MTSYKHTFLRSALVNDPFCLGDLGPEDVLRIESEFPDLFNSGCQEPEETQTNQNAEAFRKAKSPRKFETTLNSPLRTFRENAESPRHFDKPQSQLRKAASSHITQYPPDRTSICSRGDRCTSACNSATAFHQPHTKSLNKFPLRKGPIPTYKELQSTTNSTRTTNARLGPDRPTTGVRFSKGSMSVPTSASLIIPLVPVQTRTTKKRIQRKSDSQLKKLQSTFNGLVVRNNLTPERQDDPRLVILHSIEKRMKTPNAKPTQSQSQSSTTSKNQLLTKSAAFQISPQIKSQTGINLRFVPKVSDKFDPPSKQKSPEKGISAETEPHYSSLSDINQTSSGTSSCTEFDKVSVRRLDKNSVSQKLQEAFQNVIRIQNPAQKFEKISIPKEGNHEVSAILNEDPISKLEQLVLTKLLAAKYEKEGKFQKKIERQQKKTSTKASASSKFHLFSSNKIPNVPPHPSLVERLTQELIRAEILKYIHSEDLYRNGKVDIGMETESNLTTDEQTNDKTHNNICNVNENHLSTIDEESVHLVTPELTPPSNFYQYRRRSERVLPDRDPETIKTPEITPPSKNKTVHKNSEKFKKQGRPTNGNSDVTDCSSISDFVFSDEEKFRNPPSKNKRQHPQIDVDVQTPSNSKTSLPSVILEQNISLSTPAKSGNETDSAEKVYQANIFDFGNQNASAHKLTQTKISPIIKSRSKISISRILSEFDNSTKSALKLSRENEGVSEGEFLLTPYKSNDEITLSYTLSPGLYLSNDELDDDDTTEYGCLSNILEVDTISPDSTQNDPLSNGEAQMSTKAILSRLEHLLTDHHFS